MARLFENPLVLAQNIVGSFLDNRAVVLYEQEDKYKSALDSFLDSDKKGLDAVVGGVVANLKDTVGILVGLNGLKELFIGIEIPVLSAINGFNAYGISYMSGSVDINSDIAEHPVEDGTVITDTAILNPITATVDISMPTALYTRIYRQIYDYYVNKKKIMMKTKFGMIKNLVISAMPFEMTNASIDRPVIQLSLRQIVEVKTMYVSSGGGDNSIQQETTLNASDSDTADLGRVTPSSEALSIAQALGV